MNGGLSLSHDVRISQCQDILFGGVYIVFFTELPDVPAEGDSSQLS